MPCVRVMQGVMLVPAASRRGSGPAPKLFYRRRHLYSPGSDSDQLRGLELLQAVAGRLENSALVVLLLLLPAKTVGVICKRLISCTNKCLTTTSATVNNVCWYVASHALYLAAISRIVCNLPTSPMLSSRPATAWSSSVTS